MCTINMTFEVPDTKLIDLEALKQQIQDIVNVIIARPNLQKKETAASWTEEFRGKWQDDNITAEDFVREIRNNRNARAVVEL